MSKYVPHVELGKCPYDKCPVPYRAVFKDEQAVFIYTKDKGIACYHPDCYFKLQAEKRTAPG